MSVRNSKKKFWYYDHHIDLFPPIQIISRQFYRRKKRRNCQNTDHLRLLLLYIPNYIYKCRMSTWIDFTEQEVEDCVREITENVEHKKAAQRCSSIQSKIRKKSAIFQIRYNKERRKNLITNLYLEKSKIILTNLLHYLLNQVLFYS